MPKQSDAKEIRQDGKVSPKRQFDARDWRYIGDLVISEWDDRKKRRKDREKVWTDIDRQIAMQPNCTLKKLPNGQLDPNRYWMSEIEPPLQAQAQEVLVGDARRMMFAEGGPWFRAHAELTDKYLDGIDFSAIIKGDEAEVPSQINQDNADKLSEGFLYHQFKQYDFFTRADRVNAETFKYGCGVARGRKMRKSLFIHEASGSVRKENQVIPIFVPCSVKKLYLDDKPPSIHSAQELGPGYIYEDYIRLTSIQMAASKGSTDPDDEDGGWMPKNLKDIEPDKDGYVTVLEYEGDIVVPRDTVSSLFLPGAIVTVLKGDKNKGGDVTSGVIRFRWRKSPYSSYLLFPYLYVGCEDVYPTSPLEKGRPIQIMIAEALNRSLDSAALKIGAPVSYDRTDTEFARAGGPVIHPYAMWGSTDPIKTHTELGGEPGAMAGLMQLGIQLYAELTGVLPARLGAQTVSHTTAFAKNTEIERGASRTVKYVKGSGQGPLTRWLHMAYDMGRNALTSGQKISFYIDAYGGYVEVTKDHLPEGVTFEWFGAGGPSEEQIKAQRKLQSLQLALQMDELRQAKGLPPVVDSEAAIKQVLREGTWTDLDAITNEESAATPAAAAPVDTGLASTALQSIAFGGRAA
jgi:hypothetical protein